MDVAPPLLQRGRLGLEVEAMCAADAVRDAELGRAPSAHESDGYLSRWRSADIILSFKKAHAKNHALGGGDLAPVSRRWCARAAARSARRRHSQKAAAVVLAWWLRGRLGGAASARLESGPSARFEQIRFFFFESETRTTRVTLLKLEYLESRVSSLAHLDDRSCSEESRERVCVAFELSRSSLTPHQSTTTLRNQTPPCGTADATRARLGFR